MLAVMYLVFFCVEAIKLLSAVGWRHGISIVGR